ncbi:uncharacterized protein EAF01_005173 [Botrytis porri]|uniref:uncharacterized protein n=1 Tax=Botrytis porri TaxID=87229 RepID=UPI001902AB34|nr:uncharacterized protein EAF01_005173 [Botrytis porri]KAF7907587.1 hypothetical protein EAF01_005173 [Botrytis porri]
MPSQISAFLHHSTAAPHLTTAQGLDILDALYPLAHLYSHSRILSCGSKVVGPWFTDRHRVSLPTSTHTHTHAQSSTLNIHFDSIHIGTEKRGGHGHKLIHDVSSPSREPGMIT